MEINDIILKVQSDALTTATRLRRISDTIDDVRTIEERIFKSTGYRPGPFGPCVEELERYRDALVDRLSASVIDALGKINAEFEEEENEQD